MLEALRLIAEFAKRSLSAEEIESQLSQEFKRNIEAEKVTAVTTTAEQQQYVVKALADNLGAIADQKKEIQELGEEVKELREYIKTPALKRIFKRGK